MGPAFLRTGQVFSKRDVCFIITGMDFLRTGQVCHQNGTGFSSNTTTFDQNGKLTLSLSLSLFSQSATIIVTIIVTVAQHVDPLDKPTGCKKLSECNMPMSRMMQGIKVNCPYHKHAGTVSTEEPSATRQKHEQSPSIDAPSCNWAGSFGNLLAKHLAACACHPMPCPSGCDATIRRGELVEHEATCPKQFDQCSICGDLVRAGAMAHHRTDKSELHVQLLEQQLAAKEAELALAGRQSTEERLLKDGPGATTETLQVGVAGLMVERLANPKNKRYREKKQNHQNKNQTCGSSRLTRSWSTRGG